MSSDCSERTPVLALKSKDGEIDAVRATAIPAAPVTVMVELLDDALTNDSRLKRLAGIGAAAVVAGRPLWVDIGWLNRNLWFGARAEHPLEHLDARIERVLEERRERDLWNAGTPALVPVIPTAPTERDLFAVRMLLEHTRREVVLRSRGDRAHLLREIDRVKSTAKLDDGDLHLLLDEGYVSQLDPRQARGLADTVTAVAAHHRLASIGLLAGSTPRERNNYETHLRERVEVKLCELVRHQSGFRLRYGDYGVVHPVPRAPGGRGSPANPYIHYTVPGRSLFIARRNLERRKNGSVPPGSAQKYFLEVADELVRHEEFAGPDFSWGDRQLFHCRYQSSPTIASSPKWIALGTSHHLAHLSEGRDARR
ncbi:hypothetical protein OOZ19_07710 [Saccharopolyspora sp. NFXS83]|uniref:beta family protein n=1 Tax=Saccharopolyspora sp. NFXS83 TaxID=2993560 RepID=UPI00224B176A|nr:hypothetical protein [Saccharopolyspora sp. NFXS83]MCX2730123.1 hypothetical protein [Saccharopolyspora sp. NFXS83]